MKVRLGFETRRSRKGVERFVSEGDEIDRAGEEEEKRRNNQ